MITGIAASALDALQALIASKPTAKTASTKKVETGFTQAGVTTTASKSSQTSAATATDLMAAAPKTPVLSSAVMGALLAEQSKSENTAVNPTSSKADALKSLYAQLDSDADGSVTKAEFVDKLGAGGSNVENANSVFGSLDRDGDGAVSVDELSSALVGGKDKPAPDAHAEVSGRVDSLRDALKGASSQTTINSEGVAVTSLTNANGLEVALPSQAATRLPSYAASRAISSYNYVEQLMQRSGASNPAATKGLSLLSISV